jgi:hypothetical protein
MTSMQLSSSNNFDTKKLSKVLSSNRLLTKYIDNVKSMSASTALQYRSELNSFAKFVYKAYDCDLDSLIDELYNKGTLQKKANLSILLFLWRHYLLYHTIRMIL